MTMTATGARVSGKSIPEAIYSLTDGRYWFEDFGLARLADGKADVRLAPGFAEVIIPHGYYVFLTPHEGAGALYVARRDQTLFEVREAGGGASSATFGYRIVARRKDTGGV